MTPTKPLDGTNRASWSGADVLDEINKVFRLIEAHPQIGQRVSRAPRGREIRAFLTHRFPYAVIYEVLGSDVFVLAVAHTSRRQQSWRQRMP